MALAQLIPRIALILIFLAGAGFAYTESIYMHDHAVRLGQQGGPPLTWMWIYRVIGFACFFAAAFIAGSFFRK